MFNAVRSLILLFIVFSISACVSDKDPEYFALSTPLASEGFVTKNMHGSIRLGVVRNMPEKTQYMYHNVITKEHFVDALSRSLSVMGLSSSIEATEAYVLDVAYEDISQPSDALDLDKKGIATFNYRLIETKTDKVVFDRSFTTDFTATVNFWGEVFAGAGAVIGTAAAGGTTSQIESAGMQARLSEDRNLYNVNAISNVEVSAEGKGPRDGWQRIAFAMRQAVAMNIRKAMFEISNFKSVNNT